jgi:hypothetical protein
MSELMHASDYRDTTFSSSSDAHLSEDSENTRTTPSLAPVTKSPFGIAAIDQTDMAG